MADAIVGTCVTSCDQVVAGADKGNFSDRGNTIDPAMNRGAFDRAFARVVHMPSSMKFETGCSARGTAQPATPQQVE